MAPPIYQIYSNLFVAHMELTVYVFAILFRPSCKFVLPMPYTSIHFIVATEYWVWVLVWMFQRRWQNHSFRQENLPSLFGSTVCLKFLQQIVFFSNGVVRALESRSFVPQKARNKQQLFFRYSCGGCGCQYPSIPWKYCAFSRFEFLMRACSLFPFINQESWSVFTYILSDSVVRTRIDCYVGCSHPSDITLDNLG